MNFYEIAGLRLGIDAKDQYLHPELTDFLVNGNKEDAPDIEIVFQEGTYDVSNAKKVLQAELLSVYEEEKRYIVSYNAPTWVLCYTMEKETAQSVVFLREYRKECDLADMEKEILMYSIRDAFFFHMQKWGRIAVHSASIIYKGKVWLFSASSGTGKSTHAALWKEAGYGIKMFNGDVAVCYEQDGKAFAAGIPWCGTSHTYVNRILPLGGILFLQRSCHNEAGKINLFEGIMRLNARCLTPNWTRELMDKNLFVAEKLIPLIKTGVLYCTPETKAAEVAKEFIDR